MYTVFNNVTECIPYLTVNEFVTIFNNVNECILYLTM